MADHLGIRLAVDEHHQRMETLLGSLDDVRRAATGRPVVTESGVDVASLLGGLTEYLRASDGQIQLLAALLDVPGETTGAMT